jgi:hypothetical protein
VLRLTVVQNRVGGLARVPGVDVAAVGGFPVLLQPGPGPGVAIRCPVHPSWQTVILAGRNPGRLPHAAAGPGRCGLAGRVREKVSWW